MPKGRQNAPAPVVEETNVPSGSGPVIEPVHVLYCSVCSLPPEYCEFGSSVSKCKAWLQEEHPDLFDKYYSEDALQQKAEALSLEAQAKLDKKAASMEAKADVKAEADSKKKKAAKVRVTQYVPTRLSHCEAPADPTDLLTTLACSRLPSSASNVIRGNTSPPFTV
ncbi:Translation machinery-associated protein 22 [Ceratobasidium sp. 428]|nr:Translation machinery-associated protein 22 [Ceratobasidium sp. 428]